MQHVSCNDIGVSDSRRFVEMQAAAIVGLGLSHFYPFRPDRPLSESRQLREPSWTCVEKSSYEISDADDSSTKPMFGASRAISREVAHRVVACLHNDFCKSLENSMPKKDESSLDTLWVETFISIVDNHGFEEAAKAMNCSQSTITTRMSKLESWFGHSLFDRNGRQAVLNNNGQLAYMELVYISQRIKDLRNLSRKKFENDELQSGGLEGLHQWRETNRPDLENLKKRRFKRPRDESNSGWWEKTFED